MVSRELNGVDIVPQSIRGAVQVVPNSPRVHLDQTKYVYVVASKRCLVA